MTGRSDCCGWGTSFEAKRWLSMDGCGFVCVSFSLSVHIYATTVIGLLLISDSMVAQIIYGALYLPITFLAVWSLYMAWSTNPGAVPMGARPLPTVKMINSPTKKTTNNDTNDTTTTTTNNDNDNDTETEKIIDTNTTSTIATTTTTTTIPTPKRAIRRCHKCNDNYKPNRAHHDSVTGRCIVKFDHYCPWVGNAVGALNHKFFVLFIAYTICACILSLIILFLRLFHCGAVHGNYDDDADAQIGATSTISAAGDGIHEKEANWHTPESKKADSTRLLPTSDYVYPDCTYLFSSPFCIILAIASVTFLIFTCCMMVEQLDAIESNQSKIARMKLKVGEGGTELQRVSHDFNEMFGGHTPHATWHWFLPLPITFPPGMDKIVLGYEWDPTYGDEPFQEDDLVAAITSSDKLSAASSPTAGSDHEDDDNDLEANYSDTPLDDLSDSLSLADVPNGSLHSTGTKKRTITNKKTTTSTTTTTKNEHPKFVDRTKGRLT